MSGCVRGVLGNLAGPVAVEAEVMIFAFEAVDASVGGVDQFIAGVTLVDGIGHGGNRGVRLV